jgi:TonB-dependent SusC/RagA subfamily outer membrane receptor
VNGEPYPVNDDIEDIYDEDIAELVGVDPDDIKDITILKDAAATAIWGEKGRNGVIEIKTKSKKIKTKGKKTIRGTVSDANGPLWGANVVEINEQGRIVKSTTTDSLGHFTLKTVNPKDKIRISYIGSRTVELNNNLNEYNIVMQDATKIKDVPIRKRNVNIDDFEGILPSTNPTKPIQK